MMVMVSFNDQVDTMYQSLFYWYCVPITILSAELLLALLILA